MLITCYAFSDRTLQVGHTYYSIGMGTEFYFNLETYEGFCYFDSPLNRNNRFESKANKPRRRINRGFIIYYTSCIL